MNKKVLDNFFQVLEVNDEIRAKCQAQIAYKRLIEKGVPYKIYLRIFGSTGSEWGENECFLELKASKYIDDVEQKFYFMELLDKIKFYRKEQYSFQDGYLNRICKRNSVTDLASIEAEKYVRKCLRGNEKFKSIIENTEGQLPYRSGIRNLNKKANEIIYPICKIDAYHCFTSNNNGNGTDGAIIIGIPLWIK